MEEPRTIKALAHDSAGRPVPWFVQWFDGDEPGAYGKGRPDFRVVDSRKIVRALKESRCFICGEPMGASRVFVVGPMCVVNRISGEPPNHRACALYSVQVCPFLVNPEKLRREHLMGTRGEYMPPGQIDRNPGVSVLWTTRDYKPVRNGKSVVLGMGDPTVPVEWWNQGRPATHDEAYDSLRSGLPILRNQAVREGTASVDRMNRAVQQALALLPGNTR